MNTDTKPLSVEERRRFALARLPDAERLAAAAEAAFAETPRGSRLSAEAWRERNAATRRVAELQEMLAGPEPLSSHGVRDPIREAMASAPPHWMAALQAERRARDVPHHSRGAPWADGLTDEQRSQLATVAARLGRCAAAELELPCGMLPEQLAELAGTGPHVPESTPGYVQVDGTLLGWIVRGLPRAFGMCEQKAQHHVDPAFVDRLARARVQDPEAQR
jgi:hypothetical protein